MHVNISIHGDSTPSDLNALAEFCTQLAATRGAANDADDDDDNDVYYALPAGPVVTAAIAVPTTRRRRTKAEIAADEAAAEDAAAAAIKNTAADLQRMTDDAAAEDAAAAEPADGKTFTEADVQALATVVARAHGPDTVKDKIAELGGTRIADLDAAKLNALGAFLESTK